MAVELINADVMSGLSRLPDESIQCVVTSPPYWRLRDYGADGQIGLEDTPEEYVQTIVRVFREIRRVLRSDGTAWLNIGDRYADKRYGTIKPRDLCGIPWRVALALQADGWWLRQDIIWHKPNPMPESVRSRCTSAHEYLFLLTKSSRYFYDNEAIKEPALYGGWVRKSCGPEAKVHRAGDSVNNMNNSRYISRGIVCPETRNKRSVWKVATQPYKDAHFAVFPECLVEPCVLAGTSAKGRCPACGVPWHRVVSRDRRPTRPGVATKIQGRTAQEIGNRDPKRHVTSMCTTGWKPGCQCAMAPVPCVVLDPFCGSGTTGVVAVKHGRDFVGIEINAKYVDLARKRIDEGANHGK